MMKMCRECDGDDNRRFYFRKDYALCTYVNCLKLLLLFFLLFLILLILLMILWLIIYLWNIVLYKKCSTNFFRKNNKLFVIYCILLLTRGKTRFVQVQKFYFTKFRACLECDDEQNHLKLLYIKKNKYTFTRFSLTIICTSTKIKHMLYFTSQDWVFSYVISSFW